MNWFSFCFDCFRSENTNTHSYRSFNVDEESIHSYPPTKISYPTLSSLPPMPPVVIPMNIEISQINQRTEPECVICLGEFNENDPMIPTLCSCGENKAFFHLPCLLHYKNRYNHCPVCKGKLYYQEMT